MKGGNCERREEVEGTGTWGRRVRKERKEVRAISVNTYKYDGI